MNFEKWTHWVEEHRVAYPWFKGRAVLHDTGPGVGGNVVSIQSTERRFSTSVWSYTVGDNSHTVLKIPEFYWGMFRNTVLKIPAFYWTSEACSAEKVLVSAHQNVLQVQKILASTRDLLLRTSCLRYNTFILSYTVRDIWKSTLINIFIWSPLKKKTFCILSKIFSWRSLRLHLFFFDFTFSIDIN